MDDVISTGLIRAKINSNSQLATKLSKHRMVWEMLRQEAIFEFWLPNILPKMPKQSKTVFLHNKKT